MYKITSFFETVKIKLQTAISTPVSRRRFLLKNALFQGPFQAL